jgi:hypothetical protein
MQQLIINKVEDDEVYRTNLDRFAHDTTMRSSTDVTSAAISLAARQVADISKSKAIIAFTTGGGTALSVSKLRPKVPIIAACYSVQTARWLAMAWGVYPIVIAKPTGVFNLRDEIAKACEKVTSLGFADGKKDLLTVTAGLPFGMSGSTNVIRVISSAGAHCPTYPLSQSLTLSLSHSLTILSSYSLTLSLPYSYTHASITHSLSPITPTHTHTHTQVLTSGLTLRPAPPRSTTVYQACKKKKVGLL